MTLFPSKATFWGPGAWDFNIWVWAGGHNSAHHKIHENLSGSLRRKDVNSTSMWKFLFISPVLSQGHFPISLGKEVFNIRVQNSWLSDFLPYGVEGKTEVSRSKAMCSESNKMGPNPKFESESPYPLHCPFSSPRSWDTMNGFAVGTKYWLWFSVCWMQGLILSGSGIGHLVSCLLLVFTVWTVQLWGRRLKLPATAWTVLCALCIVPLLLHLPLHIFPVPLSHCPAQLQDGDRKCVNLT